ncbi:MAG: septum formation protein Maf [Planctomycetota bacterium]|nr:MAG: septum formation protein Maf [Planctomycetota bacterium]
MLWMPRGRSVAYKLILASASPRRRKLLEDAGFTFTVQPANIEEQLPESGDPEKTAIANSLVKARWVARQHDSGLVVGADTVVSYDSRIIGKPVDEKDAISILQALSGTRHKVVTGIAIIEPSTGREVTAAETTGIVMRQMSDEEIRAYVDSGEATGKAGAYAIQETGDRFVEKIEGSFSNVVGFPIDLFRKLLADFTGEPGDG